MSVEKIDPNNVIKKLNEDNVKYVNLQFCDMLGQVKSVTIPATRLQDSVNDGTWFDGSSIKGFTRILESDMLIRPDLNTYAIIPWINGGDGKTARIICDVFTADGKPYESDPRYILKKILKEADDMGYVFNTGPELEFFLFKLEDGKIKTSADHVIEPHDKGQYFDMVQDQGFDVRKDMVLMLQQMGLEVEASHHEVAPGQHEIDFKYGDALSTADKVLTMKATLKAVAKKHGLYVTFMPKPIAGINGSGMHVHQSLFDKNGNNLFFDGNDKAKLSKTAYNFIAGQMKHARGMSAILNPIVNSYKRLVPGYEAATYICWARQNRSALMRVPRYTAGRDKAVRYEIRCPDPSSNPYLVFAVLLKAGLEGIKQNLTPPPAVEENVFEFTEKELEERGIETLPYTLWDALKCLEKDQVITSMLGSHLTKKYLEVKREEWDDFRTSVTDWEIKEYLETV